MYHMVCDSRGQPDERYCCPPRRFRRQMAYLKWAGYRVVGLDEIVKKLRKGEGFSEKTVALTFDDGFRDNHKSAWPVLRKYGYPATVFVVSGLVGRTNEWMEQKGFAPRELASWKEIQEMAKHGIEIGSHTVSHAALTNNDAEKLYRELVESKKKIERHIGKPVRFFAYPYGLLDEAARAAVIEAGYEAACSTRSGFNNTEVDPFILRRIEVYGTDSLWHFALKIVWGTNDANLLLIARYYFSRTQERFKRWISAWT